MGVVIRCCKDCENKGCGTYHDICPKYLAEKKRNEMAKKLQFKNDILLEYKNGLTIKIERVKRNKRRK